MKPLSTDECITIAEKIRKDFFYPRANYRASIFLCGADINDKTKIRFKIAEAFTDKFASFPNFHYTKYYDLIYPEDIFDELLYNKNGKDLLSLENILANSIDVILIIPESPGSFAELGAFANDSSLRSKMICLIDEKYKKHKSFINQGPVKLIKKSNKNGVIFIDPQNLVKSLSNIISTIREIKKKQIITLSNDKINLLQLELFLLPTIYLLEPVKKEIIFKCIEAVIDDTNNLIFIVETSLNIISKKKFIELSSEGYKLTKAGKENYLGLKKNGSRVSIKNKNVDLDHVRLEVLNLQLRNKKFSI